MPKPNVRVTLERGRAHVDVLAPGIAVEVRDYDVKSTGEQCDRQWTDEKGRTCVRYFVPEHGKAEHVPFGADLERFAADLNGCAGVSASLEPDPSPDGLHVLTINRVDFYFSADGCRYDGWGKWVGD